MNRYPEALSRLIDLLQVLPGVGKKSAERFAFHLLKLEEPPLQELGHQIAQLKQSIHFCSECGCIKGENTCYFCESKNRKTDSICIISSAKDAFAIDETGVYHGLYHVIDHLLSPIDGYDEKGLKIDTLLSRIKKWEVKEVIIALDSTLEGDATSLYLKDILSKHLVTVSRLAFGIPIGSSLEFIDEGTLSRALSGRQMQF